MNFENEFPLIYCLNLAKRQDRRARCEELFERHNLHVQRFPAVDARLLKRAWRFESKGRYAHAISTLLIIRRAMQLQAPSVFIFEDDVQLAENWREEIRSIELPQDWGLFYLGCQHQRRPDVIEQGLVRVKGALDTHAWGIRSSHFRWVTRILRGEGMREKGLLPPADLLLAQAHEVSAGLNAYACFPNLAWQIEEYSNLVQTVFSNYDEDGMQRPAREAIGGVYAECLGLLPCADAVKRGRGYVPFYKKAHSKVRNDGKVGIAASVTDSSAQEGTGPGERSNAGDSIRIAFLFLTRDDLNSVALWDDYFARSGPEHFGIYLHAKAVEKVGCEWLRRAHIEQQCMTQWGDISLVRAMLALLEAGCSDPRNTHFMFVSESCVPIRPMRELVRLLEMDNRSRFVWKAQEACNPEDVEKISRMQEVKKVRAGMGVHHSQWVLLERKLARKLVEDDATTLFEKCYAPDEFYFGTMLKLKGCDLEKQVVQENVTWTNWELGGKHPRMYREVNRELVATLAASGHYFARKFAKGSNIAEFKLHAYE